MPNRTRSRTTARSKLDAERVVRDLAPDAVIVRPPVVYGPRDTDVFQLLKSISKGLVLEIAGGERWFSAIYVKDLVEGLLAAARHASRRRPDLFPGPRQARVLAPTGGLRGANHGTHRRACVTVPFAVANAVGACAEVWARLSGKPGIISREKIAEARCMAWTCDTARAAAELGFVAPTSLDERPRRDPRLVQGGRLADILKRPSTTRRRTIRASGRWTRSSLPISPAPSC